MASPFLSIIKIRPASRSALKRSLLSALAYVLLCTFYICFSGWIAANTASTTQELQRIETIKGVAFIVVTGALFFVLSFAWWRRIERQERLLLEGERANVAAMCHATMAHDLNNLVMSISGLVEALDRGDRHDDFTKTMRDEVAQGLSRLTDISKRVASSVTQLQPDQTECIDLRAAIARVLLLVQKHPDIRSCTIDADDIATVSVHVNKSLFEEALINLIINGAQATGPNGNLAINAEVQDAGVRLEVHDDGPGIPQELRSQIFDPCYTTKAHGTGLGLLAVKAFVSAYKADISVGDSHLGGAVFKILIPLENRVNQAEASARQA